MFFFRAKTEREKFEKFFSQGQTNLSRMFAATNENIQWERKMAAQLVEKFSKVAEEARKRVVGNKENVFV